MQRPPVFRIPALQLAILLLLTGIMAMSNPAGAMALLFGGLIAIIPHGYFTLFAYRYMGARSSHHIAQAFKRGETGKFVLTLVGFATVFSMSATAREFPLWVFVGYMGMLAAQVVLVSRAVK